jgi:lipopolysaccharide export system protein LptA
VQAKDQIVITGDVVVVQGQNVARGDKLTITVSTREADHGIQRHRAGQARTRARRVLSGQNRSSRRPRQALRAIA